LTLIGRYGYDAARAVSLAMYESVDDVGRVCRPEPLRWLGVTFVRRGRLKMLEEVERSGRYPEKPTLAQRLWEF
jgi:hypothetical protein